MNINKEVNLKLAQDYLEAFCELLKLHKEINPTAHPNFPSLFTEGLIKHILKLKEAKRTEKCGDFKLKLNGNEVCFEVKGTSSADGTTTIGYSKAKYIIWIYVITSKDNQNKVGISLIYCDCKSFNKDKRSNITLGKEPYKVLIDLLKPTIISKISKINKDKIHKNFKLFMKNHRIPK